MPKRKLDIASPLPDQPKVSSRTTPANIILRKNNFLSALRIKTKGVIPVVGRLGPHAYFETIEDGILYVFNGNDGKDGFYPGSKIPGCSESVDGSPPWSYAVRPLVMRTKALQTLESCYFIATGLANARKQMPWKDFLSFAMKCTEVDLIDYC